MLEPKLQESLDRQINAELYSSYLYLSMAAHLEAENFRGMAQWMRAQSGEETAHAMKIYDYVLERNGRVTLARIDGPKTKWASPLELFEDAYAHEQKVTAMINNLMDLAVEEKDHASHDFLEWFVTEQVEEESNASAIVEQLKLVGDSGVGLYMIDQQLGQRTPSTSAAE
ncbi:MAG: ferritin [Pirellulales bacterium]|nr:ferritin [Pirellulales bacterium]